MLAWLKAHRATANGSAVVVALSLLIGPMAATAHQNPIFRMIKGTEEAHPNALWHVVHGLCMRDVKASGSPSPCAAVDLAGGYAVLKDISGKTQFLLIPTTRVTGIESPELLAANSPNYWKAAWSARRFLEQQVGHPVPRDDIGLAVNSVLGRTQNQLHIHIDCVKPAVIQALHSRNARIGPRWTRFGGPGRRYRVRWISDADLVHSDPFKLLARTDAGARADMGRETLALLGATRADGTPGFFLLSNRADVRANDLGASEELLDHRCQVLSEAPRT